MKSGGVWNEADRQAIDWLRRDGWTVDIAPAEFQGTSWVAYDVATRAIRIEAPTIGELIRRCAAQKKKDKAASGLIRNPTVTAYSKIFGGRS